MTEAPAELLSAATLLHDHCLLVSVRRSRPSARAADPRKALLAPIVWRAMLSLHSIGSICTESAEGSGREHPIEALLEADGFLMVMSDCLP